MGLNPENSYVIEILGHVLRGIEPRTPPIGVRQANLRVYATDVSLDSDFAGFSLGVINGYVCSIVEIYTTPLAHP